MPPPKHVGFTLAEVLITLGIIGVVASLTIPQLIANHQKKVTVTKLKKAYSIINQTMLWAINEHGDYKDWDDPLVIGSEKFFNKYISPYINNALLCDTDRQSKKCDYYGIGGLQYGSGFHNFNGQMSGFNPYGSNSVTFLLPDGTTIIYYFYFGDYLKSSQVLIDINGPQKPNAIGKDVFAFNRTDTGTIVPQCKNNNTSFINSSCSRNGTGTGLCCAAKIINEGWEIKYY